MENKLWEFIDNVGTFKSVTADKIKTLYFPLCNETIMSSISPGLHGDIKTGQNSFLLAPVSRIDLVNSKASRNFWIYIDKDRIWSARGAEEDSFSLEAGLLWHKITRENKKIGLRAEILSFVPAGGEPVEIMQVKLTNISSQKIKFTPTAAIPIYARGANNLRDHRHVTSLLQRITLHKFGVISKPTLAFDESGHKPNKTTYFVLGWDEKFRPLQYIYPTQEMFCGDGGDLEAPESVLRNILPKKECIQGKEAMGALRFAETALAPGKTKSYIILMGISEDNAGIKSIINKFSSLDKVKNSLERTKNYWVTNSRKISLSTGNLDFDNWFCWVNIQPALRKIFGCSFLPDFDYGKGGRGWRDLWQDCLCLILDNPQQVRRLLVNNFSGVRIDGSNATIIKKNEGEFTQPLRAGAGFISDRNNISRVWMDHGIWPLLTLDLYLNETGDFNILFEQVPYFRNHEIKRARAVDLKWRPGKIYTGIILEHLLVQNLVQFFNVGRHNFVRLEGADWNDGLDMAKENGESVTFSSMYAQNLLRLSELIEKTGKNKISVAKELKILLQRINYNSVKEKFAALEEYFEKTAYGTSGEKVNLVAMALANDLRGKAHWMMEHIRKREWLKEGFFNGYYDNRSERVEGMKNKIMRIMLSSQVFPIMSETASDAQVAAILRSARKYLFDKKLKGYHLNTDFKEELRTLGRAFSFVYGDKENGAFFNHMVVMFAYALYKRGFVREGWQVLNSIYNMAIDTEKSKIYPCLPEYFNLEGKGMYSYLTGSASWFVLTMLTQVFGVRGDNGNLLIEPKLCLEQFRNSSTISINRTFAGKNLVIIFFNPKKLEYGRYRIIKAILNSRDLALKEPQRIVISRKSILKLPSNKVNSLKIILG
jgi:cellobiose phosphorylase